MIKIIKGVFGYNDGRKVTPITEADGPRQLPAELEKRLVAEGVAEYVDASTERKDPPENGTDGSAGAGDTDGKLPEYNDGMKLEDLKKIAIEYGVPADTVEVLRKKADVIAAINAAKDSAGTDDEDDEDPPAPGAADPV